MTAVTTEQPDELSFHTFAIYVLPPTWMQTQIIHMWRVCLVRWVAPGTHTTGPKNHAAKHRLRTQKFHK